MVYIFSEESLLRILCALSLIYTSPQKVRKRTMTLLKRMMQQRKRTINLMESIMKTKKWTMILMLAIVRQQMKMMQLKKKIMKPSLIWNIGNPKTLLSVMSSRR